MKQEIKDRIIELRNQGVGYRNIANELNISRENVRYFCLKNNLGGVLGGLKSIYPDRETKYKEEFNEQYIDRWVYESGYINNVSGIVVKCLTCNNLVTFNASCLRQKIELKCKKCISIKVDKDKKEYEENKKKLMEEKRLRLEQLKLEKHTHICKECHEEYYSVSRNVFCSNECMNRHNNSTKKNLKRKRISENGVTENITLTSLIKRDKNVCHLCGGKCDRKDYTLTNQGYFIAGESYPSIDHVIPVSKGGTHTWDNVKLAHMSCNSVKSDNSCYEMINNAIRMCI